MLPLEGGTGPLGPLLPDHPVEFIVGIVLFLVIWFVMAKKVVPLFEATYAERADAIRGGIERAEKAQAEAQAALASYKAQLADARGEAARIREDAKFQGAQIATEMREQANAEAGRIVTGAHAQVEADRKRVLHELRQEVGGLATTLAGRIVGESLDDDERAARSVDRFIAELEANDAQSEKV